MISDRLDDALGDSRLLDAHLANCDRCVEHERRVVQAQDGLVAAFAETHASLPPTPVAAPEPPALKVIEEAVAAQPLARAPESAAEPPHEPRGIAIGGMAWGVLVVLAVLLTLAAIVLAVTGALGGL